MNSLRKYLFMLVAPLAAMAACSEDPLDQSGHYAFFINKNNIEVGRTSAVIQASYVVDPTVTDTAVEAGIMYAESGWSGYTEVKAAKVESIFSVVLDNLQPGTVYLVKAYVKTADNKKFVSDFTREFTTLQDDPGGTVTVSVAAVNGVTDTEAVFRGEYTRPSASLPVTSVGFKYRKDGTDDWKSVTAEGSASPFVFDCSGLSPQTKYYVKAWANADGTLYESSEYDFTTKAAGTGEQLSVDVVMSGVTGVTKTQAALSAYYVVRNNDDPIASVGFKYRADGTSTWTSVTATGTSESFSHTLTGLTAGTKYYVTAWIKIGSITYDSPSADARIFTTESEGTDPGPVGDQYQWAELPVMKAMNNVTYITHYVSSDGKSMASPTTKGRVRNYTICYDESRLQPLWVAAPMHDWYSTKGTERTNKWAYDPYIGNESQPNLSSSYKANGDGAFSRGHMVASSDRLRSGPMNNQTFYYTNMAPQTQDAFNGGIWEKLEKKVLAWGSAASDTVYVVTGSVFNGTLKTTKDNSGNVIKVPSQFYKVVLSSKTGNTGKPISQLKASELKCVGFWLEHFGHANNASITSDFMVSVSEIETKTGFSFFPMLSDEAKSVKNTYSAGDWGM